jgi:hypothetical protein
VLPSVEIPAKKEALASKAKPATAKMLHNTEFTFSY